MDRETIIRMVEEAGLWWQEYEGRICPDRVGAGDFEKFAQLVAAHERDACILACYQVREDGDVHKPEEGYDEGHMDGCNNCAAAIHARK